MTPPVELKVDQPLSPALQRLGHTVLLSTEEIEFFEGIQNNIAHLERGDCLLKEGNDFECSYIIRAGWIMSYKITSQGRRQIVSIYLPGDFLGLHVNFIRRSILSYDALTKVEVALVEPMRIIEIHQRFPILASGLDWSAVRHLNILSEHNVSLGARSSEARLLHLYLELWCRLMLVGEASAQGFEMRLTQEQTGDVLGLTPVHINRTIKKLSKDGLIEVEKRHVTFPDVRKAIHKADFDAAFLQAFRTATIASRAGQEIEERLDEVVRTASELVNA